MNREEAVKALIEAKANLEIRNKQDMSPLLVAITRNKPRLVRILLEAGAQVIIKTRNKEIGDKLKNLNDEVKMEIERHQKWLRLRKFAKFYKMRERSSHFPQEYRDLNPLLIRKIIKDYM